jgi:FKBP-type peptidyl-prolyl cis-trans isomerase FkpA
MKKISIYLFISSVLILAMACNNQGFKKTKSGLMYKIISNGQGEPAKKGQFLKINFVQRIRDSVWFNSATGVPFYPPVDSVGPIYSASEIFTMLRKGDSAVVVLLADSIMRKNKQPLPPPIKKKDKIMISFKVLDVFANQGLVMQDKMNESQKERGKEIKAVEDYLASNKINTQKTAKGTYVEIESLGDGLKVDSGKQVSVRYTGKLFPSGKVFESNMNDTSKQPIKFVVGRRAIIQGWDDGLRLFKKGGKGTLYIPAFLAYDAQPGPGNKTYENLIFDVEIIDVTDAPKQVSQPGMPNRGIPQRINPQPTKPNNGQPPK